MQEHKRLSSLTEEPNYGPIGDVPGHILLDPIAADKCLHSGRDICNPRTWDWLEDNEP